MTETSRRYAKRFRSVETDGVRPVDQILSATLGLLDRKSFNDISVADILTESKVSRTTFYFYFASKFSVLSGLLTQAMDDIFETVQPFLSRAEEDSPEEALERSLRAVTTAWHRHRLVLQAAAHHWHSDPELNALWLQIVERFVSAGAEEIERERAAGKITSSESGRTLAAMLFWGTERVLYIAGLGVEPSLVDEEAALGPLVALWHGTLYG
ncbi:TetR family transcriptional regulator [Mycolicibacterium moriokaense]|uniref:Transcriptional regulator, TetR family protein n=1 Tax=Mycolicibacterium moriokaense TaxID=39691 RepID=A0AAD1H6P2_9MYCO|nr:TetR/AcrR family transcriptional regulator [Mycolicibacterium moriokaense]MCV7037954.1 TetR/AcrR family transcriptional regulator [Mycolicibacterium moriokaense]ORB19613.1 TetR family transcriptional regulator [Mycolicibacterium moriokaense]BBW99604.1 putative transcriptional regulator, TetR family protein [Mycolicibacterium moriokaense]